MRGSDVGPNDGIDDDSGRRRHRRSPQAATTASSASANGGRGAAADAVVVVDDDNFADDLPSPGRSGSHAATTAATGAPSSLSGRDGAADDTAQMRRVLGRIRRQKNKRGGMVGKYASVGGANRDNEEEEPLAPSFDYEGDDSEGGGDEGRTEIRKSSLILHAAAVGIDEYDDEYGGIIDVQHVDLDLGLGVEKTTWWNTMCPRCCRGGSRWCWWCRCCGNACTGSSDNESGHDDLDDIARERPTNEMLLSTAFLSFTGFTTVQFVVAFIARSEAMMGDSAAMAVDALTYGFNLAAERMKNRSESEAEPDYEAQYGGDAILIARARRRHALRKRKLRTQLELVPPLISLGTLLVVIGIVLDKAVRILILDAHRPVAQQSRPNVLVMGIFSALNLCLDFLNVFCFARAKHAMGFAVTDVEDMEVRTSMGSEFRDECAGIETNNANVAGGSSSREGGSPRRTPMTKRIQRKTPAYAHLESNGESSHEYKGACLNEDADDSEKRQPNGSPGAELEMPELSHRTESGNGHGHKSGDDVMADEISHTQEKANLNMCSAYTHVFADTLRSIAVVIASILAESVKDITPEEADATAAVVVSLVILMSLIPLVNGLIHTWAELKAIRKEEAAVVDGPEFEDPLPELAEGSFPGYF